MFSRVLHKIGAACLFALATLAMASCATPVSRHQIPEIGSTTFSLPVASDPNCLAACPTVPNGDHLVRHTLYTLANNGQTKFADWVAYVVREENIGGGRPRRWRADPDLTDAETLEPDDYSGLTALHYQRGHQAPLASFGAAAAWAEMNYLSNITPQNSNLNGGRWGALEDAERTLARTTHQPVYVVTGTLYEHAMPSLPHANETLTVPSGYWKIVSLADGRTAAFVFENRAETNRSFCLDRSTMNEIARRARLTRVSTAAASRDLSEALGCASRVG